MALLEGLEISELLLSQIPFENSVLRMDAEYFKKQYLKEDKLRAKHNTIYLGEDYFITDGQHGYHEVDEESNIRHLTAKNFKNWFANDINADRLAKQVDDNNKRSSLKLNDIVLTTRGSVGYCAIVKEDVLPANIDQDVARIATININKIAPQFLLTYLNSKFGQDWTLRNQTGMVQQGLALWRVRELPIPNLSTPFQEKISELIEMTHSLISQSKDCYTQAENLLLKTLNLQNFQPSQEKVNVKNFKDSFLSSGRLDAEYYQVKYEEIIQKIKESKYARLSELVSITKSIEPGSKAYSDEGLPFLRVADYNKFGISKPNKNLSRSYCNDNAELIESLKPKKDTILFSKDGSVGTALVVRENLNMITSGAILHLKVKKENVVLPQYLALALNSFLVQMQAERDAGGSIILHWRPDEIKEVLVPIIDYDKQVEISDLIEESFRLKEQSEHLLEVAKRAVEVAIEEGEEKGIKYIEK
ncbi:MAG: restriction endonuclease subunit S [Bacteroidales bacterium]|nr:restriction endonuclease subunit S [Bacteroidales bacterium]